MRRLGTVLSLFATFFLIAPAWPQEPCQYAHVVDRCDKRMAILPTGSETEAHFVTLNEGPAAAYEPGGVALATVPGWDQFHAFVPQGPYLHVIDYLYYYPDDDPDISPRATLDLVEDLNWTAVHLTGVAAGGPLTINNKTHYPLYVVGYTLGTTPHPYVMILDQQALLDGQFSRSKAVIDAGYLDHLDGSGGIAIDVAVGATLDDGHRQVAYASVLRGDGDYVQQFHTITLEDGVDLSMELDPWNDEGLVFLGFEPDALGLDYDSLGQDAFGVFPTSSVEHDLDENIQSCELGPGDLTDVAVWGPDPALQNVYMHFATTSNEIFAGVVLGYPEGVCPYSNPPQIRPGALVLPIDPRPLALALSSRTANPFWLYTANASGSVTALELQLFHDPENGDSIAPIGLFQRPLDGCPSAIVFRDPALEACMVQYYGDPPGPRPDDYCDENPFDQWCLTQLKEKPGLH